MVIAVASGKGGTGKTTVAVALAQSLAANGMGPILISDCDVEAPNAHLFLNPSIKKKHIVYQPVPGVDREVCTGCGTCGEVCQFNAVVLLGGKPKVFPSLCHGCGSCVLQCPEGALEESNYPIGMLEWGTSNSFIQLRQGRLKVGEPLAVPVISSLKDWKTPLEPVVEVVDSPPGASCPVVEAVKGADYVLLVTEPTPFGLHDLKAAIQVARELQIPAGVIVNRAGIGQVDLVSYCEEVQVPVLLEIPLDRKIGEGLAQGLSLLEIRPEYQDKFLALWKLLDDGRRNC